MNEEERNIEELETIMETSEIERDVVLPAMFATFSITKRMLKTMKFKKRDMRIKEWKDEL